MLSYNDLYELLRKEKYSETLQQLPKGFFLEASEFLKNMRQQSSQNDDFFAEAVAKSKKQFENSVSIFKELMRLRKRKILSLVFIATETGLMKRDYENMLPFEKDVFDKLVKNLEEADKEMSRQMIGDKDKKIDGNAMVLFTQEVEQFVDMNGNTIGPFSAGQLANLAQEISDILVASGKARLVDS